MQHPILYLTLTDQGSHEGGARWDAMPGRRESLMGMQAQCINTVVIQINRSTKELKVEIVSFCYLLEENYDIQTG